MLSITHLVVSLLLIQLLGLDRNDAFIALVFGVFIDLDHLFGLRQYTEARGMAALLDFDSLMNPGGQWKSMFHSPMAVGIIAPLSLGSRLGIPILFWGVHLLMDFAEDAYLGLFSAPEAMLLALTGLALVSIRYARSIESETAMGLLTYLRSEFSGLRNVLRPSVW
ncbi:MAG: hypothetical protein JW880_03670 [Candidatus Thermoplasmatota archaeon]|nr:hypothetical protein [Candidatus Thermoplasmatota archaeon]